MIIVEDVTDGITGNKNSSDADARMSRSRDERLGARRSDARGWCGFELYIFICGETTAN